MVGSGILSLLFFFLFLFIMVEENVTTRLVFIHHVRDAPTEFKDSKTTRCRDSKLYLHINALLKGKSNV